MVSINTCWMVDLALTDYRFVKTVDQSMNKEIKTKVLSFHSEILTNVLEGYAIPSSVFAHLEKALKQIAEGIKLSGENAKEAQQYWIMFTKYEYENISRTVQARKYHF